MKFGIIFEESIISEWKDFYIDYNQLKMIIKKFQQCYQILNDLNRNSDSFVNKIISNDESSLIQIAINFKNTLILNLNRVYHFVVENNSYYNKRIQKISKHLNHILENPKYNNYMRLYMTAIKELYKEINLMKEFISINQKAEEKITKKFKKYAKACLEKDEIDTLTKEISKYTIAPLSQNNVLNNQLHQLEKLFCKYFNKIYNNNAIKELKRYVDSSEFNYTQIYIFGLFSGLIFMIILLSVIIMLNYKIDMDDDLQFSKIFPVFRGVIILTLYLSFLCLNVYIWNKNNINYKLCMKFTSHYSTLADQLKRVAIFCFITSLMILFYLILRVNLAKDIFWYIHILPVNSTPLICWLAYIFWLFFPIKNYFNYEGRMYLARVVKDVFLLSAEFHVIWFSDQLVSLSGFLRDIGYTLCYYIHFRFNTFKESNACNYNNPIFLLYSLFPACIRIAMTLAICYRAKTIFHMQFINAGKYAFSLISGLLSYKFSSDHSYYSTWVIVASINAFYSFLWDLKMDWGFLESNAENPLLRKKLSFKDKKIYYIVILGDLIFRYFFILSLSPQIMNSFIRPEFFTTIVLSAEVLRRSLWNFIRVENRHIELMKEFRSTQFIETAFVEDENGNLKLKEKSSRFDLEKCNKRLQKIRDITYLEKHKKIQNNEFIKRLEDPENYDYFIDKGSDSIRDTMITRLQKRDTLFSKI